MLYYPRFSYLLFIFVFNYMFTALDSRLLAKSPDKSSFYLFEENPNETHEINPSKIMDLIRGNYFVKN